jgi:hypothetical protein
VELRIATAVMELLLREKNLYYFDMSLNKICKMLNLIGLITHAPTAMLVHIK